VTVHDTVHVGGVSESCKYNDHSECRAPGCGCDCHRPAPIHLSEPKVVAGPEKACPKCGLKRPFVETYCRIDGERLASLLCGVCGSGMNPEDSYCYNCGGPKGSVSKPRPPRTATEMVAESSGVGLEEADRVLKSIQEELSVQQPEVEGNQRVVERPAGAGGSFKLVSSPSPNKVRPSKPVSAGTPAVPRRLPIKPS